MYPETRVYIHVLYPYFNISIIKIEAQFLYYILWPIRTNMDPYWWPSMTVVFYVLNCLMMILVCPKHVAYENTFLLCRRFLANYLYICNTQQDAHYEDNPTVINYSLNLTDVVTKMNSSFRGLVTTSLEASCYAASTRSLARFINICSPSNVIFVSCGLAMWV
jgi:hypothetical protein